MSVNTSLPYSLIKLSNVLVFPGPELPIIKIVYRWFGVYSYFGLCSALFSFVITSRLKVFVYSENGITLK